MNAPDRPSWTDANQRLLVAEFAALRARFGDADAPMADLAAARAALPEPAAIDQLAASFGLSDFERGVLLLAAGVEMDSALARLVPRLTFSVALGALPGAHWSAIGPLAPLRAWRLVVLDDASPTQARLRIDERILHHLAGINQLDARLGPLLHHREPGALMAAAHRKAVAELMDRLRTTDARAHRVLNTVQLAGDDADGQRDVAAAVARSSMRLLFCMAQADIPGPAAEQETLAVLWQREAALLPAALLIEADDRPDTDTASLARFVARLQGLVFVATRDGLSVPAVHCARVDRPDAAEQRALWTQALADGDGLQRAAQPALLPTVQALASQFRLSAATIAARASAWTRATGDAPRGDALWRDCLAHSRPGLDALAQRIDAVAGWDDLVLPSAQLATLRQLAAQVRQRSRVYADWGFAAKGPRGLGISALFFGESGVGKTMASEVLARELDLDLYRVDLSGVVSKYIGETEKNLRRVFDAAEGSGVVLLFDEADALFGKRSEVRDSHDRYANIEVGYLLQRMETYRGLSVLTTNQRAALDPSFLRRLRFVVQFPFPDQAQREAIWRRVFPAALPQHGIDHAKLARLQMPGGHIRNVALNAAFLAADAGTPLTMAHLAHAAQLEAAKHERPLGEQQTRGVGMKVVLHIDRLVLKGIPPAQRDALVTGLRDGLAEALSVPGAARAWAASGHQAQLRARLPAAGSATDLGQACARAIVPQGPP